LITSKDIKRKELKNKNNYLPFFIAGLTIGIKTFLIYLLLVLLVVFIESLIKTKLLLPPI